MAFQTFFGAMDDVARIEHSKIANGSCMLFRRFSFCMLAKPGLRRAVAILAAHTFGNFKRAAALLRRRIKRVTCQALRRIFGSLAKFQNACHAFADGAGERLIRAAVFVLQNPSCVFGLKNAALSNGLDAAVATGRCT